MSYEKRSPRGKVGPAKGAARLLPHSTASKVCALAGAVLIASASITAAACGVEGAEDKPPAAEQNLEDFDLADDGAAVEAGVEYDTMAVASRVIYEARAVDLRITAIAASAGVGGGEIELRVANEYSAPLVVEISDMSVGGEGVAGAGRAECEALQITSGSVSFLGESIAEVDDLDLWHAKIRILTPDGDEIETGTASLTGAFE